MLRLFSYSQYGKIAAFNTTHLRRQSFYALPQAHWQLLAAPPFSYLDTLNAVDEAIDKNAELAMAIHKFGLEVFGVSPDSKEWQGFANASDMDKARSTLRQFYRDWSSEGSIERDACLQPVIADLLNEFPQPFNKKVLIPGAGLARLVFELCQRGFETQGNEISFHQLLASNYILNHCSGAGAHTVYPWVHSFSNHFNRSQQLQGVSIPDTNPSTLTVNENVKTGAMSMSASDFLCLYGNEDYDETFDAVSTVFFLDTAPNPIRYIETIRSCLRPGGIWINLGPLLWHFENNAPGTHGREGAEKNKASDDPQGKYKESSYESIKLQN